MNARPVLVSFLTILLVLLCACSSPRITMEVASQPNVNPDNSGRPSPVILKMYEMRGDMAFRQSDFQTLFEEPMKVLGAELVAADELTLVPGEARTVGYAPMPETRFVGIIAGFRQLERADWRRVIPVNAEKPNLIRLELNDTSLILIDEGADWSPENSVRSYQERLKQPEPAAPEKPQQTPATPAAEKAPEAVEQGSQTSPGYMLPQTRRTL